MKRKKILLIVFCLLAYILLAKRVRNKNKKKQETEINKGEALSAQIESGDNFHLACPYTEKDYLTDGVDVVEKYSAQALILPHHLLAKEMIGSALSQIKDKNKYQAIVIAGPNHRNWGQGNIQTSLQDWKTRFGEIKTNTNLILGLENNGLVSIEEENFDSEHSICSLISFVGINFPQADIVPLILKSSTTDEQAKRLGEFLGKNCTDCLLIISTDFSHEVSSWQAEINDSASIEQLENIGSVDMSQVICDSVPSLKVMQKYLKEIGIGRGTLIQNSNSQDFSSEYLETVTSYVIMVW